MSEKIEYKTFGDLKIGDELYFLDFNRFNPACTSVSSRKVKGLFCPEKSMSLAFISNVTKLEHLKEDAGLAVRFRSINSEGKRYNNAGEVFPVTFFYTTKEEATAKLEELKSKMREKLNE